MAKTKKPKLSRASQNALDSFDAAAKDWGWVEDQGTGRRVITSEENYNAAKKGLVRRILFLEKEAVKLKARVREQDDNYGSQGGGA